MPLSVTCPRCNKRMKVHERPPTGFINCLGCEAKIALANSDRDDDDGTTYAVETRACPKCRDPLASDAVLCIKCGYNLKTKKMMQTEVKRQPIHRIWWTGITSFHTKSELIRERDGELSLTMTQHIFFIPVHTREVNLEECLEIQSDYTEGLGPTGIIVMMALIFFGCVPGLFWWWLASQYPTYTVSLALPNKRYATLYSGWNENTMRDILETLSEAAKLTVTRK